MIKSVATAVAEIALNDRVINDNVIDRDVNKEEGLQLFYHSIDKNVVF